MEWDTVVPKGAMEDRLPKWNFPVLVILVGEGPTQKLVDDEEELKDLLDVYRYNDDYYVLVCGTKDSDEPKNIQLHWYVDTGVVVQLDEIPRPSKAMVEEMRAARGRSRGPRLP